MQVRLSVILSGVVLLLGILARASFAEDTIRAFVTTNGRVVFTNLVDNTPPPAPSETIDVLAVETPAAIRALVDKIATNYGVDPGLVRAVIKTESNFNRFAISNKGALGLMQLIPNTGRRFGVRDFFDPQQNVDGGVHYLRFLLDKFKGNLDLSLAAYNAGENLVEKLGRIPPIPETTNYVRRVRAIYRKPSAPLVKPIAASPAMIAAAEEPVPPPQTASGRQTSKAPVIFKVVDEYGVAHYSNVGPPN